MTRRRDAWLRFLLAAVLLISAKLLLRSHYLAETLPQHEQLASLPLQLEGWVGVDLGIRPEVRKVLGEGDFLQRVYRRSTEEPPIDLFLAYFPSQRTGTTIHSPQHCLPGGGWMPTEHSVVRLLRPSGGSFTVNRYVIANGSERRLALYWYQAHGRVVASEYWAKFYLVADSIRMNRSDASLVRIITSVSPGESIDAAQERATRFVRQLTPLLGRYIPR